MTHFAVESVRKCVPELNELARQHHDEIGDDVEEIPLDVNWEALSEMEDNGKFLLVTVRSGGELVGYYMAYVYQHLHHRTMLSAFTDSYYLKPEYRGRWIGYKMIKYVIDILKSVGVKKFYISCKLTHDAGSLLERIGFIETERDFSMVLK